MRNNDHAVLSKKEYNAKRQREWRAAHPEKVQAFNNKRKEAAHGEGAVAGAITCIGCHSVTLDSATEARFKGWKILPGKFRGICPDC